jgi:hypothetical protein
MGPQRTNFLSFRHKLCSSEYIMSKKDANPQSKVCFTIKRMLLMRTSSSKRTKGSSELKESIIASRILHGTIDPDRGGTLVSQCSRFPFLLFSHHTNCDCRTHQRPKASHSCLSFTERPNNRIFEFEPKYGTFSFR